MSFSSSTLGCHETQLGTSTFVERNHSDQEIPFKNASGAFREYFYGRYCTFPGSDSPSTYWIDYPKIQVSCLSQPRKCPKHPGCDRLHFSTALISPQTPFQISHHRSFRFYPRFPLHRLCLPPFSALAHPQWLGSCNQQLAILALPKQCFETNRTSNFSDLYTFSISWRFSHQIKMEATTAPFPLLFLSPFPSLCPRPSFAFL